ncbi:MAG: MBL fold metallo-hydrolase [Deltaproteobacteria bacterium]|nr:MBL fold metallo-hydrolase [Deltaproteobacteria bacterium]
MKNNQREPGKFPFGIYERTSLKQTPKAAAIIGAAILLWTMISGCAAGPDIISSDPEIYCIQTGFTNSYLIKAKDGYLLIDTSYYKEYDNFTDSLRNLGLELNDISYILLTHHHDDHSGFAARLVKNTDARLIVYKDSAAFLEQGTYSLEEKPLNVCVRFIIGAYGMFHEFTYPPVPVRDVGYIVAGDDADLLKQIGIDGEIIHTPGHTNDSITVVLKDGKAFVGDAAMDLLNICMCEHRPIYINSEIKTFESWQKMKEHGARIIYSAHGSPFPIENLMEVANKRHFISETTED